eukprot:8080248-Pyramimonas_sp.AAC.1
MPFTGVAHNFLHDERIMRAMPSLLAKAAGRATGGPEDLVFRADRVEIAAAALQGVAGLRVKIEME